MREIDLKPPEGWDDTSIVAMVEEVALAQGLNATRGALKSFPGCTHWHFTQPKSKGTLEATWWPKKRRLWLKIHPMREAEWMPNAIQAFQKAFPTT